MMRGLWLAGRPFSLRRASAIGARFMGWLGPRTSKHAQVLANLRIALPGHSAEQLEAIARGGWANTGAVLAEYDRLDELTVAGDDNPFVETVVSAAARPHLDDPHTPCIFVTAHLGNWELAAYAAREFKGGMDIVYNPQKNPLLERAIQQRRTALGGRYLSKVNVLRALYSSLRQGRSVGLLVDFRVSSETLTPFFGVDAETTLAPAWLSLKTGAPILPIQVERLGPGPRFRITAHEALDVQPRPGESDDQAIGRVTATLNDIVADWIRAHPDQWLCTKRRWPKGAGPAHP